MKILVVEDDCTVAQTLQLLFSSYNYAADIAADGEIGLQMVELFEYDLILLDLILPKLDGIALCQELRARGFQKPILLLTGQSEVRKKAIALNAGADDYVVKPFDAEELIARVQALFRRGRFTGEPILTWGKLSVEPSSRQVVYGASVLSVTPKEYAILELFLRAPQKTFNASTILDRVWTSLECPGEEAVRVHIKELRQKLTAAGAPKDFIKTQHRVGYQLNPLYSSTLADRVKEEPTLPKVAELTSVNEELRLALEALQESEAKYRTLFASIDEGFALMELIRDSTGKVVDMRYLETNEAFARQSQRVATGKTTRELFPSLEDSWLETYARVAETGESVRFERHFAELDAWYTVYASRVGGEGSNRIALIFDDISDRKRTEAALQESETRYRTLFEQIDEGFSLCELVRDESGQAIDYRFLEINPAAERIIGTPRSELIGRLNTEILPNLGNWWQYTYQHVVDSGESIRFEKYIEPLERWFDVIAFPSGGDRFALLYDEISDRKRAEILLRENQERQTFLLELSDALRPLADPIAIQYRAVCLLGKHLKANRVGYAEDAGDGERIEVTRNYTDGVPGLEGRYHYDDCGSELLREFRAGRTVVRPDIANDPSLREEEKAAHAVLKLGATVNVPLVKGGHLLAVFFVHSAEPRDWSAEEVSLVEDVAERVWSAVDRARTEAALRDREELLRTITQAGLWTLESATGKLIGSPEMYRLHGLDPTRAISHYDEWFDRCLHPEDRPAMREFFSRLLTERPSETQVEFRIVHPQQGIRWLLGVSRLLWNEEGELLRASGIVLDITDRKLAEIALKESEARFRHFAENSRAIIWIAEASSLANQYVSPSYEQIWGSPRQSSSESAESWLEAIHPEDRAVVQAQLEQKMRGNESQAEYRIVRPDGSIRWISSSSFPIRNEAGEIYSFGGIAEDITGRKLAEIALRESEARFARAFNYAAIGMTLCDLEGNFSQVNSAFCQITGYDEAELIGTHFAAITHPEDLESDLNYVRQLLAREISFYHLEKRYIHKQGHIIWILLSGTLIEDERGQPLHFVGQIQDISDRKQAEFLLQQQMQRERLVADIARDIRQSLELDQVLSRTVERVRQTLESDRAVIFRFRSDWHAEAIVESVAEDWQRLFSTTIFDPCFRDCYVESYVRGRISIIADLDRENLDSCYIELLKTLHVKACLTVPLLQGERLWGLLIVHHCTAPHPWQTWEIELLEQLATQVSIAIQQSELYEQTRRELLERKAAEQKIQEQAALLDITSDAIFVRDFDHRILYWNRGAERMYGWRASEAIGQKASELLHENVEKIAEIKQALFDAGEWHGELRKRTKTGKEITIEGRWTLARDAAGQPQFILTVNTDITEKKQLEAQFYRAQRLESLGTLASGIAHDLNNVLTPVVAISQVLRLRLPELDARSLEMLKVLEDSAKRGAKTIEQILTFTRGTGEELEPVSVGSLLQQVVILLQQTLPKSVSIRQTIPNPMLGWVSANSTYLQQVFMNLCVNAGDAMPDGGILSLSVEHCFLDGTFVQTNLEARVGDYVVVTVADTGTGIPVEVRDRIFEPFFTTKPVGKGTGLGLATVLGIVKHYGGFVQVFSEVGRGTEVKVYLPAMEGNAAPTSKPKAQVDGDGATILAVDDDLAVLESTRSLLECSNYTVVSASSGAEAIALYARYSAVIRAAIVDATMPEMSGIALIQRLKETDSNLKIIAMSGLSANRAPTLAAGANVFLSKPYIPEKLLGEIQALLKDI